jgi:hypothetical protein
MQRREFNTFLGAAAAVWKRAKRPTVLLREAGSPRRTAVGGPVRTAGGSFSVYDPCHLSGRIVIESMSLYMRLLASSPICGELPFLKASQIAAMSS